MSFCRSIFRYKLKPAQTCGHPRKSISVIQHHKRLNCLLLIQICFPKMDVAGSIPVSRYKESTTYCKPLKAVLRNTPLSPVDSRFHCSNALLRISFLRPMWIAGGRDTPAILLYDHGRRFFGGRQAFHHPLFHVHECAGTENNSSHHTLGRKGFVQNRPERK